MAETAAEKRKDDIAGEILHVYDGIEEADNQLPLWWVAVFLGSIAFAMAYWLGTELYHARPSPAQEYAQNLASLRAAQADAARNQPEVSAELLASLANNPQAVAAGAVLFQQNCVACHADHAQGNIGPNLTDNFWLHGGSGLAIHTTIGGGVLAKGMPAWGAVLGEGAVRNLTAFVLSLRGRNAPGKAPQGEPYLADNTR
jgi:cytochrome c oxidase cbb3-type subunit 3